MIFNNVEIFNAAELIQDPDGGYGFLRVPTCVDEQLSEMGRSVNRGSTGVELRFVLRSGEAKVVIRNVDKSVIRNAVVFYGDFVADWPETEKKITGEYTELTIVQSPNIEAMREIAKKYNHRFSPDLIRIVFKASFRLLRVEGDVTPPTPDVLPKKKYLAYGSSITHGSISLERAYEYAWKVGEALGADTYNLGYAGSARLEKAMADYLAEEREFDFATLEMGINILGIEPEDFENRVRYFLSTIADHHPDSKIFAIDVFYCHSDLVGDGRAATFRQIVKKVTEELARPNIVYINGLDVLPDGKYLSSGLVHPGPRGIELMSQNLIRIISENL